jgi:hypothetical protein
MKYNLKFVKQSKEHKFAGVGFAGNIFIILNSLMYIKENDDLHVDIETNECCCSDETQTLFDTKNCWEFYFNQTTKDSISSEFDSLLDAKIHYNNDDIFMFPEKFMELKIKFWRNFDLNEDIKNEIKSFYEKNILGKKTLGVQVRLTDMKHYHNVSPVEKYLNRINEILLSNPEIEQIFLSTDDSEVIDYLENKINKKIIYYKNMFRATKDEPHLHPYDRFNSERPMHKYLLGLECCQEIFTLTKCDYMLKADVSAISIVASILSENIKKIYKL